MLFGLPTLICTEIRGRSTVKNTVKIFRIITCSQLYGSNYIPRTHSDPCPVLKRSDMDEAEDRDVVITTPLELYQSNTEAGICIDALIDQNLWPI